MFPAFFAQALRRGLAPSLLLLGLCAAPAHAGTTYAFDGGKVLSCSNKAKVYTCDSIALPQWDDRMIIGDGYTVNVSSDVVFGYNHGLAMSGSARLTSSGNIDLTGLNPPNLVVTGGSFDAGKAFSVAGPNQMKADVSAGSLSLGTGPTFQITGTMLSRGAVAINSGTTVVGSVSGAAIMTNSPFRVTGNLNASDTLLIASGGTVEGTVVGNTSITINSPATLNKSVTSQGPVSIGSGANIGGVVKGSTIIADSPVTLRSDIIASERFTLGSGSTVTGNITAPEVELYASGSTITGNVTASKLLTMADRVTIKGAVDTGQLTMYASSATIEGSAKVDFASMQYAARVTQAIVCKSGTRAGLCDCVDNQTGFAASSAEAPRCESGKPPASPLHHFLITHDGVGQTCAPESVTVTACANATCSAPHYSGGASVTLQPGAVVANIGSGGSATAQVSRNTAGSETLRLSYTGTVASAPLCRNTAPSGVSGASSCNITFSGGVAFNIDVPNHRAAQDAVATIKAVQSDPETNQCVAAFKGTVKQVQYSCGYDTTSKDTAGLTLADATLVCRTGASKAVATSFDANGEARLTLNYQDVGKLKLMAQLDDARGDKVFTVAPHSFGFSALPVAAAGQALRAGDDFKVTVNALNAKGAVTPSFDNTALQPDTLATELSVSCVPKGDAGSVGVTTATSFVSGSASPTLWWSEVGTFDLKIGLANFLGSGLGVSGSTKGADVNCLGKVGPFIPKYFMLDQTLEEIAKKRPFYYAGEPVPVRISAMNSRNALTRNYDGALGYSAKASLAAYDKERTTLNPNGGKLTAPEVEAGSFKAGVALASVAYAASATAPVTVPAPAPIAPTLIVLRAATAAPVVTSYDADGGFEKVRPLIRSGRLRIGSKAGRVNTTLALEVATDYWSGYSWLLNDQDNVTRIPVDAFAQTSAPKAGAAFGPDVKALTQAVVIENGKSQVSISGNRAGWIDVAVNLGVGPKTVDLSCQGAHPPSTGANLPWLRLSKGCRDPAARATFGELAPENRRIIHLREVFN